MADSFTETPVKGKKTHNSAAAGNTNIGTLPAIANNIAPSFTEGNQVGLSVDLSGALRVLSTASGTQTVALDAASLAALETISIGTALPAGTNNIGDVDIVTMPAVALDSATLAALENTTVTVSNASLAVTGTFWQATQPVSGTVALDAGTLSALENTTVTVANATLAVTGPLTDTQLRASPVLVTFNETAGTITDSGLLTTASVAAGASTTFNSTALTAGTPRLLELSASSSVRLKVVLQTFDGTTATSKRVFFVDANQSFVYAPRDIDTLTVAAGAGVTYRLVLTNMDNLNAADVYASLTWSV